MVLIRWNRQRAGNGRCDAADGTTGGQVAAGGVSAVADDTQNRPADARGQALSIRLGPSSMKARLAALALLGGAAVVPAMLPLPALAASFWYDPDLAAPGTDPFGDPDAFGEAGEWAVGEGETSEGVVHERSHFHPVSYGAGRRSDSGDDWGSGPVPEEGADAVRHDAEAAPVSGNLSGEQHAQGIRGPGDEPHTRGHEPFVREPQAYGRAVHGYDPAADGRDGYGSAPLGHGGGGASSHGQDAPGQDASGPDVQLPAQAPLFWRQQQEDVTGRRASRPGRSWGCRPAAAVQTRLKIDNDLASGEDYGYSSGVMLEVGGRTSAHDGREHEAGQAGLLCPLWRWLGGGHIPSEYVSFRLDQAIYTPEASRATWLLTHDRPYAATLMATLAAGRLQGSQRVRNELRLGWVGPSIRGEKLQNAVHRVINAPRFRGWAHQLHDEPLLEWAQYRVQRWQPGSAGWDVLGHWGLRLGNLQSSAFAGLEWRTGNLLQDDGGSAPLRPGSNEPAELQWSRPAEAQWTTFVQAGARAVAWDLTLDGNAWHDSHHVKRSPFVLDAGAGVSVRQGRWSAQFMWVVRSREFRGQRHVPSFGSLQIGYAF